MLVLIATPNQDSFGHKAKLVQFFQFVELVKGGSLEKNLNSNF